MLDNTETVVEETVVEVPEVVEEVVETEEIPVEEVVEETTEEVVAESTEETTEEASEEAPVEAAPILFDGTEDDAGFAEKKEQIFAKYDLSEAPELQSLIETLEAKAQAVEAPEIFSQIADYGDVEAVTAVLDEHNTLYSRREENGSYRPNTDKFVETLVAKDKDTADYLYFDLASQPSAKYPGITKFEEGIAEALALDGETVNTVLHRYQTTMKLMKEGAAPTMDVPSFIPSDLYKAYNTLSKETRETMQYWDTADDATDIANKLGELRNIQKGIDAEAREQQYVAQAQQERQQRLVQEVETTQSTFFNEIRNTMAEKLKGVQFSTDPKLNSLLSRQQVTTLTQAFLNDGDGEFARQALAEAGINFDYAKAQKLVESVHQASQNLAVAKHSVDAQGKPLNPVELSKAQSAFKSVTENWLKFADDILKQEKEIATTGTAKALEQEVAKIKVAPKARPVAKSVATAATNGELRPPQNVLYGTPEWDGWWAKQHMANEAKKASAYA